MISAQENQTIPRLYGFSQTQKSVVFFRRGEEYTIETNNRRILDTLPYLQTTLSDKNISNITNTNITDIRRLKQQLLAKLRPTKENREKNGRISGKDFYQFFRDLFDDWMKEAFAAPYWEKMLSGTGSKNLFAGYLIEIFHYTKNANRHMPLAIALCPPGQKRIKRLLSEHYKEEWNHYHFFSTALRKMGYSRDSIENSDPLPSTLAMSNFMRQAASTSMLSYTICSAILEGTTEAKDNYGSFFHQVAKHYDIPDTAIQPIFDHLALDEEYGHKSLFEDICREFDSIPVEDANLALSIGQQLVDHILLWTMQIDRYYSINNDNLVRCKFNIAVD